jgi:organic hydroperoxide reductase OsmC/OhrA
MRREHSYAVTVEWLGNRGTGTSGYRAYGREHVVRAAGKHDLEGSSDRVFHGNPERWNPEELLLAALSQCHLLSYLHVAANAGVIVTGYTDAAVGTMVQTPNGGGHFTSATLRPRVTIASGDADLARALHQEASEKCFIAASVNFPVLHEAEILLGTAVQGASGEI